MTTENNEWEQSGPEGVGGWLVLLIAGLLISAAVRSAIGIRTLLPALGVRHGSIQNPTHAGLLTGLLELFAAVFALVTAVMLIRRNWKAVELARVFLFTNVVFYIASLVWVLRGSAPYVTDAIPVWAKPAALLAASGMGFAYAVSSRRIANTYKFDSRPKLSHWEETSILPRIRARDRDESEEAEPMVGLAERLSMRSEPITADAEARLMTDLKARIAEHVGTHRVVHIAPEPVEAPAPRASEPEPRILRDRHREEPVTSQVSADPGPSTVPVEAELPLTAEEPIVEPAEATPFYPPQATADAEVEPPVAAEAPPAEEPDVDELTVLKARISDGLVRWMRDAENSFKGTGAVVDEEKIRARLLKQVDEICDHAWAVHVGMFATLPNTPDSGGSLSKELQKWAVAQAALRLTRSLDIRAAMQVRGRFEEVAEDRDYLLAIAQKNASDDGFGKSSAMEYKGRSAPEIAYKLIINAQRDLSEARMWAEVASLAGDADFIMRFEDAGSKTFQESLQYWRERLSETGDPGMLQGAGNGARPGRRIPI